MFAPTFLANCNEFVALMQKLLVTSKQWFKVSCNEFVAHIQKSLVTSKHLGWSRKKLPITLWPKLNSDSFKTIGLFQSKHMLISCMYKSREISHMWPPHFTTRKSWSFCSKSFESSFNSEKIVNWTVVESSEKVNDSNYLNI